MVRGLGTCMVKLPVRWPPVLAEVGFCIGQEKRKEKIHWWGKGGMEKIYKNEPWWVRGQGVFFLLMSVFDEGTHCCFHFARRIFNDKPLKGKINMKSKTKTHCIKTLN